MHLRATRTIFLRTSDPHKTCSTPIGRSLLDWYNHYEDTFHLIGMQEPILPNEWRLELTLRDEQVAQEYRWDHVRNEIEAQFRTLSAGGNNLLSKFSQLTNEAKSEELVWCIKMEVRKFHHTINRFMKSPEFQELLETASPYPSNSFPHIVGRPELPFSAPPYRFP